MISATSGITVRTTSVSSTRSASGRPPLDSHQQADQDGQPGQEDEQDRPSPAEQPAQRDVDDRQR